MLRVHKGLFKNYVNFKGRARRKEYWHTGLIVCGVMLVLSLISVIICSTAMATESIALTVVGGIPALVCLVYSIAILIPLFGLSVRRLHDTGKSGWWLLFGLVPYVGSIVLFIFSVLDSQPGENKYGPNPKM